MSTHYIPQRSDRAITRAEALSHFPDAIVSDDDIKKGLTIHTADDIGVDGGNGCVWLSFHGEALSTANIYGRSREGSVEAVESILGITFVCEHDDDFDYHNFGVDVKTTAPMAEKGDWAVYSDGAYAWLYNKATDSYYSYVEREVGNINIDEMIEESGD